MAERTPSGSFRGEVVAAPDDGDGADFADLHAQYETARVTTEIKRRVTEQALAAQRSIRERAMHEMHAGVEEIEAARERPTRAANADLLTDFAAELKDGLADDLLKTTALGNKRIAAVVDGEITPPLRARTATSAAQPAEVTLTLAERITGKTVRRL